MTYLHHEPCPKCGSKDNLARYDDGGGYCFGCQHYERPTIIPMQRRLPFLAQPEKQDKIQLPQDFTRSIPSEPLAWLKKYDLSDKEIADAKIGWSEEGLYKFSKFLIFPFYDLDGLIFWQARLFCDGNKPKYLTKKARGEDHIPVCYSKGRDDSVCLVEGVVDAIKCGRIVDTVPLLGSIVAPKLIKRLSVLYDKLFIWLDPDKQSKEYPKIISLAKLFFEDVKCIRSLKDPKEYSTTEIKELFE